MLLYSCYKYLYYMKSEIIFVTKKWCVLLATTNNSQYKNEHSMLNCAIMDIQNVEDM